MRAAVTTGSGGPDVLSVGEVDDPHPAAGEVLLDVVATAVNRADTLQRQGFYPPPPGASEILGLECSGRIAELGEGVEGWKVGDEVCALLAGGGYAARVAAQNVQKTAAPITTYLLGVAVGASDADPEEAEKLAARVQQLAESWDRPADAKDPDDVDDEVPDDSSVDHSSDLYED